MGGGQDIQVCCPQCRARYRAAIAFLGRRVVCRGCGETFALQRQKSCTANGDAVQLSLNDPAYLLGRMAVRFKMAAASAVEQGLAEQRKLPANRNKKVGELLIAAGLINEAQLEFLLSVQHLKEERIADRKFGELAIQNDYASAAQVGAAMEEQKRLFLDEQRSVLVGDLLVEQGVLSAEQRDALLLLQKRMNADTAQATEHQPSFTITVSDDRMAVFATFDPEAGAPPTDTEIKAVLQGHGICHGLRGKAIAALSAGKVPKGKPLILAKGTAAKPGVDAVVEYLFDTVRQVGKESDDGTMDFRDRGEIPQVPANTELARKTPAQMGEAGMDVFGQTIKPATPKDPPLRPGPGTELSADGLLLTASAGGRPSVTRRGVISVYPELQVDGDVGFDTGHIDFEGRVVVAGAIKDGFKVRCGELIAQEVGDADVEVSGDVTVSGGIIGARIRAGGDLQSHYMHKTQVDVAGDVTIKKEAVDATIVCGGTFTAASGRLLSSQISAKKGVVARQVGSDAAAACRLVLGVDEATEREAARLESEIEEKRQAAENIPQAIEQARNRYSELEIRIGEQAQIQDRSMVRQREVQDAISAGSGDNAALQREMSELQSTVADAEVALNTLFDEQDQANADVDRLHIESAQAQEVVNGLKLELVELRQWAAQDPPQPVLKVSGVLYPNTVIKTPHHEFRVKEPHQRIRLEELEEKVPGGTSRWRLARSGLTGGRRR